MDRTFSSLDPTPPETLWATPSGNGPVVVHKRRRLVLPDVQQADGTEPGEPLQSGPRGPRVFTLRTAPETPPAAETLKPETALPPKPRRRRDAAHRPGEVTRIVITPPAEEAAAEAAAPAPAPAPEGSAYARVNAELEGLMQDVKRHAYFAHLKFF